MKRNFATPILGIVSGAIAFLAALAIPVRAEIVYHSANIGINDGSYNLDLNGDGVTDFTITSAVKRGCSKYACFWVKSLTETPASGNGTIVGPLKRGNELGPSQVFDGSEGLMSAAGCAVPSWRPGKCIVHSSGPWLGTTGYLGLSFQVNGQTHYGWAKLKCPGGSLGGGIGTLLGYVYETIPGRAILAGETSYLWFTPALLNFGRVALGTTASGSATLTNLGPTTVTITNAKLTGLYSADFASDNGNSPCTGSVAAGATCTLTFSFQPNIVGTEKASYSVYIEGTYEKLPLTGTGQ